MPTPAPDPTDRNGHGHGHGSDDEPRFEASLAQVETIVAELEGGALDLDAALARYERGVRLLARCRSSLVAAERRVALLTGVGDDGSPQTSPFGEPAGEDD